MTQLDAELRIADDDITQETSAGLFPFARSRRSISNHDPSPLRNSLCMDASARLLASCFDEHEEEEAKGTYGMPQQLYNQRAKFRNLTESLKIWDADDIRAINDVETLKSLAVALHDQLHQVLFAPSRRSSTHFQAATPKELGAVFQTTESRQGHPTPTFALKGTDSAGPSSPVSACHQPPGEVYEAVMGTECGRCTINDYTLLHSLGRGASSEDVILALHRPTTELRAIKIVTRKADGDRLDYAREGNIMKKLSHANIVRLHEVIDDPKSGKVFLVMDYASRGKVAHMSNDGTCVPIEPCRLTRILKQLTSAVHYLHTKMIFHRDIKPDNILVGKNGSILLADFGVSGQNFQFNANRGKRGTPAFWAPEVCQAAPEQYSMLHGEAIDMWALGVTMYLLYFGHTPFITGGYDETLYSIMHDPVEIPPETPAAWANFFSWILEKDPAKRMNMTELRRHPLVTSASPIKNLSTRAQTKVANYFASVRSRIDHTPNSEEGTPSSDNQEAPTQNELSQVPEVRYSASLQKKLRKKIMEVQSLDEVQLCAPAGQHSTPNMMPLDMDAARTSPPPELKATTSAPVSPSNAKDHTRARIRLLPRLDGSPVKVNTTPKPKGLSPTSPVLPSSASPSTAGRPLSIKVCSVMPQLEALAEKHRELLRNQGYHVYA